MEAGGEEERESQIQTYSLASDNISSLWLCGKAQIWKEPGVTSPAYATSPQ